MSRPDPAASGALVVDPSDLASHPTIGDALAAARNGDRVIVKPGRYDEQVVIDKTVSVIGDGELGSVVIEKKHGPCLVLLGGTVRLSRLTLSGGGYYGVWSKRSRKSTVMAAACRVEMDTVEVLDGCGISLEGCTTELNHCRALGGESIAVTVRGGSASIHSCSFARTLGAVEIYDDASVTIEESEFAEQEDSAVIAARVRRCIIRANSISAAPVGIEVFAAEDMLIEANAINRTGVGLFFRGTGVGRSTRVIGNTIVDSTFGIEVPGPDSPVIAQNEIESFSGVGIHVFGSGASPEVRDNLVSGGFVDRRVIDRTTGDGISVHSGASPLIEGNEVARNEHAGIVVAGTETGADIHGNHVSENGVGMLVIAALGGVTIANNSLVDNVRGVLVRAAAGPTLRGNTFEANLAASIEVLDAKTSPVIYSNHFIGEGGPVALESGTSADFDISNRRWPDGLVEGSLGAAFGLRELPVFSDD